MKEDTLEWFFTSQILIVIIRYWIKVSLVALLFVRSPHYNGFHWHLHQLKRTQYKIRQVIARPAIRFGLPFFTRTSFQVIYWQFQNPETCLGLLRGRKVPRSVCLAHVNGPQNRCKSTTAKFKQSYLVLFRAVGVKMVNVVGVSNARERRILALHWATIEMDSVAAAYNRSFTFALVSTSPVQEEQDLNALPMPK